MLGKVFKAYDIRATYPDPLNEDSAWKIGYGCGQFLLEQAAAGGAVTPMKKTVVVGRDMRLSSPSLRDALCEGLNDAGASVIDVGMVDTPFVYFAVNHLDCAGCVQVTASHNPPQYNGFKVSKGKAKPVGETTGLAEIRQMAVLVDSRRVGDAGGVRGCGGGQCEERDLWDAYRAHVLRFLDMGGKKIKVVVDASNGMAGTMVPKIFAGIDGLEIVELYFDNSKGEFVHEPNPLVAENLLDLQSKVRETGADLGICFDGDADRLVVVDELGNVIGCDHLTALLAPLFLKDHPGGAIVYDLRSSKAVEEDVRAAGGTPVRSRVGHVFMKAELAERGGPFGGELSGHFYFAGNFNADSGAIALAEVLSLVAASDKALSELIKPIARYAQSGEINFEVADKDGAIAELKETYAGRGEIDEMDGVTVDCFAGEGWWCNVRKSNTEPLLRLNLEARDERVLREMVEELSSMLGTAVAH